MQTRREFIVGAAGAVGLFALGGAGAAQAASLDPLLRPPGGQDEARLIASCTRCNRCRSVCPENVIVTAKLEDGLAGVRTPTLDFRRGMCTFCGKCVEVCPTAALAPVSMEGAVIGRALVDAGECIAFSQGGCQRCVDACPEGAIALDAAGRPVVDESSCNGCGLCEYVCPSASYGTYRGADRRGINVESARSA